MDCPRNTRNLPTLPVPTLEQTITKYLKSIIPFVTDIELENTKKLLEKLKSEDGKKLQNLLLQRSKKEGNWLAKWWEDRYLARRKTLCVSSPSTVIPFENFQNEDDRTQYTAKLITAVLQYKLDVDNDTIRIDKMGNIELDMYQYKRNFGVARLPRPNSDVLEYHPNSKHIIVAHRNNYFKLDILNDKNEIINEDKLVGLLKEILEQSHTVSHPVGILTADNRETWFEARNELIKDPVNKESVREIDSSLFLVALDEALSLDYDTWLNISGQYLLHGGGSSKNSGNRWYDTTLQFIVTRDGTVGLVYEHTTMEGQQTSRIIDYILANKNNDKSVVNQSSKHGSLKKLSFNINSTIEKYIKIAENTIDQLADDCRLEAFRFDLFGKDFIKAQRLSPDSFLQIALQYTYYRMYGKPVATHEPAHTRKYFLGRSESVRSCCVEAIAFAKCMLDMNKTSREKFTSLITAITAHKKLTNEAQDGFGCDRHLLGLKNIALENGFVIPEIFNDPVFIYSSQLHLAASQVVLNCDGILCYPPLGDEFFAVCYNPQKDYIFISLMSFAHCKKHSVKEFRRLLEESLQEMYHLLIEINGQ